MQPFPATMVLTPISRHPTTLPAETIQTVRALPSPIPFDTRPSNELSTVKRVSIVVLTFDNLVFTILCLTSLLTNTRDIDYELIVVDNGSTDGTREYLRQLQGSCNCVQTLFNPTNRGFAAGNNQGLAVATGEVLVLLNNDTIVPPFWLTGLVRYLDDPSIGLIGPATNRAGNEAEIQVPYHTYGGLLAFARERRNRFKDAVFDVRTATMFCVAMRRDVFERVGRLDERFETGLFEDDDYSMRARQAGYRVVCADDTFVHHFGQTSIGRLHANGEYGALFRRNRGRWEDKWRMSWTPHERRPTDDYRQLVRRIRDVVRERIPSDATVIVITRGDDELLKLDGRRAWHFPEAEDGTYAGSHPANSAACIAELERLRAKGATYLVIPGTSMWWMDHYAEFRIYLERQYRLVWREEDSGAMFAMREAVGSATRYSS